jgi:hypothetical protein
MQPSIAYTIDCGDLASGLYYLRLQGGSQAVCRKIMVVH